MFLTTIRDDDGAHRLSVSFDDGSEFLRAAQAAGFPDADEHSPAPELTIWYGDSDRVPPFTFSPDEARQIAAALVDAADRYDAQVDAAARKLLDE